MHSKWTPIPGRFKDYIALPKPNMYQSLHTVGDRAARRAHGDPDPHRRRCTASPRRASPRTGATRKARRRPRGDDKDDKRFAWLRQLMEWQRDLKDPTEFIETVKIDLFADEVYVFTPKGDVKALPKGAMPDRLRLRDPHRGRRSLLGRARQRPDRSAALPLRNGDTVEIITSPNQKPNKDWLKFVVTVARQGEDPPLHAHGAARASRGARPRAARARAAQARHRRSASAEVGRARAGGRASCKLSAVDELLIAVGYGKVLPAEVVEQVVPEASARRATPSAGPSREPADDAARARSRGAASTAGIKVAGEDDVLVRFAKCCSPLPGDPIVGFITRGRGVTVHTPRLPQGARPGSRAPHRRRVGRQAQGAARRSRSRCCAPTSPGLLAHISQSFTDHGRQHLAGQLPRHRGWQAVNTFQVSVGHLDQLKTVMRSLQEIEGVVAATRL